jgi:Putative Ig domain
MRAIPKPLLVLLFGVVLFTVCCGGGGGNSGGESTTPPAPVTTPVMFINISSLPAAVQGAAYSAAVTATYGTAPFTWSVDSSSASPLPAGLTIDPGTGIVSGTPTISGNFTITFKVVDSSSTPQTSKQNVTLLIDNQFTLTAYPNNSLVEYQAANTYMVYISGGVPPYTASIVQGSLPPGLTLDPNNAWFMGAPNALGTYSVVIAVHDSYSPQESQQVPVTFTIRVPPLQIGSAIGQTNLILNKPYTGHFYATGGTPPYSFQVGVNTLPPGLILSDPVNGIVTGTPTVSGSYTFAMIVTDSSPAPNNYQTVYFTATVAPALGRNDTPATATPITNGTIKASISPALDSTGTFAADTDYYKVVATAGSTVHVETNAKRINPNDPIDTVIELTDVNGVQFSTGCNQPGGTTTFTSPCLNDDISATPHVQDSSLDYKVPGTSGTQTFLVHVLDWSGNARPDMIYFLAVSGVN